ncbi:MAG: hypothetical protein IKG58_02240 [Bacilli bacterium]|nr:hypothetical protein [Bacilli bacterium]
MKKFKIYYIIVFLLSLILAISKGFNFSLLITSYSDKNIDGNQGTLYVLLINLIIVSLIWIVSFIVTLIKKNKINYKWLLFIGLILLTLFIPVSINSYYAKVEGVLNKDYIGIIDFITLLIRHL